MFWGYRYYFSIVLHKQRKRNLSGVDMMVKVGDKRKITHSLDLCVYQQKKVGGG
jgi:hypothetical protein